MEFIASPDGKITCDENHAIYRENLYIFCKIASGMIMSPGRDEVTNQGTSNKL